MIEKHHQKIWKASFGARAVPRCLIFSFYKPKTRPFNPPYRYLIIPRKPDLWVPSVRGWIQNLTEMRSLSPMDQWVYDENPTFCGKIWVIWPVVSLEFGVPAFQSLEIDFIHVKISVSNCSWAPAPSFFARSQGGWYHPWSHRLGVRWSPASYDSYEYGSFCCSHPGRPRPRPPLPAAPAAPAATTTTTTRSRRCQRQQRKLAPSILLSLHHPFTFASCITSSTQTSAPLAILTGVHRCKTTSQTIHTVNSPAG